MTFMLNSTGRCNTNRSAPTTVMNRVTVRLRHPDAVSADRAQTCMTGLVRFTWFTVIQERNIMPMNTSEHWISISLYSCLLLRLLISVWKQQWRHYCILLHFFESEVHDRDQFKFGQRIRLLSISILVHDRDPCQYRLVCIERNCLGLLKSSPVLHWWTEWAAQHVVSRACLKAASTWWRGAHLSNLWGLKYSQNHWKPYKV